MASVTTWTRLEPRCRTDDLDAALQARVHDPAWLIARQWALGAFRGEDAASPVGVTMTVRVAPLAAAATGGMVHAIDPAVPLEAAVGAEPQRPRRFAEAAEAGAELVALLDDSGADPDVAARLATAHPLPAPGPHAVVDAEGRGFVDLLAGRLPDVAALETALSATARSGVAAAVFGVVAGTPDAVAVVTAARAWVVSRPGTRASVPMGGGAWRDEPLDHTFKLTAAPLNGEPPLALSAPGWAGGRLDWSDVDVLLDSVAPARPLDVRPVPTPRGVGPEGTVTVSGLPAPLRYPGMPADRWWRFEDSRVAFAQVAAAPTDLARLLLVEYASVFAGDWYIVPVPLPVGAVHTVAECVVTDTFTDALNIPPVRPAAVGSPDWQMFRPTAWRDDTPTPFEGLLLPPSAVTPLVGDPTEEVLLVADETADIAWAVERTVSGADGRAIDRHTVAAREAADLVPEPAAPGDGHDGSPLRYRLATSVPAHWFPLVPEPDGLPFLRRLILDGGGGPRAPWGDLLAPEPLRIRREEAPRDGRLLLRRHRAARGLDGALYVWSGREKRGGRGEASSGLRYDSAEPPV